jgi:hypothetical protein
LERDVPKFADVELNIWDLSPSAERALSREIDLDFPGIAAHGGTCRVDADILCRDRANAFFLAELVDCAVHV